MLYIQKWNTWLNLIIIRTFSWKGCPLYLYCSQNLVAGNCYGWAKGHGDGWGWGNKSWKKVGTVWRWSHGYGDGWLICYFKLCDCKVPWYSRPTQSRSTCDRSNTSWWSLSWCPHHTLWTVCPVHPIFFTDAVWSFMYRRPTRPACPSGPLNHSSRVQILASIRLW